MIEYTHEIIDFGNNVPIKFFLNNIGDVPRHWHQSIELLFVLSGNAIINIKEKTFNLKEDDIILINYYDIHSLHAENCVLATFQINLSMFDKNVVNENTLRFDCNSSITESKDKFKPLKRILAQMIKANVEETSHLEVLNKSYSYSLLYELISVFAVEYEADNTLFENGDKLNRILDIIEYINENYTEKLSLNSVAETYFLSVPYLSKIFKKYIGVNFSDYLTSIRLSHAVTDLINSDLSIESIAEKNGFPNTRAFVSSFKNEYELLPSQYRKNKITPTENINTIKNGFIDYFTFEQHSYLGKLAEYLNENSTSTYSEAKKSQLIDLGQINVQKKIKNLSHNFKNFTSLGKAKHILYEEIQDMLKTLQKDIGFKFIKFHGILDDDMMVYSEDKNGNINLSFTYIDKIIDFLLSVNLKPLIELSFMPKDLARDLDHTMFENPSIISPPKDITKWNYLIRNLIIHFIDRYGYEEIKSWLFCLWNEPDSPPSMFGFKDDNDFFELYKNTYRTVKECMPDIIFGAPSIMSETFVNGLWIKEFGDYCSKNNCHPDFFNFHFYPIEMNLNTIHSNLHQKPRLILNKSEDIFKETIEKIHSNMDKFKIEKLPLLLTEWNSSVSHKDLLNDTTFKASYLAKNILENYDSLDSFGYWTLSDFIEEAKLPKDLFHGGLGLFTYNKIKKPHYYVLSMLNKLGDSLIANGDGYFITNQNNSYQIILYNYQHFSNLYASGELFDMTFTNRYTPFVNPKIKKFLLTLCNLEFDNYVLKETIVNRINGSCFDKWLDMGGYPLETSEEVEILNNLSSPMIKKQLIQTNENRYNFSVELQPHEVRLIELKPKY